MKRKILSVLLAVAMITVCACGKAESTTTTEAPAAEAAPEEAEAPEAEAPAAEAEAWVPEKDIECIVPFAAGGGSDLLTRKIIDYTELDVNMVAVNIEGGGGLVGAEEAALAEADGYTLLAHNPMNLLGQALTGNSTVWEELTPVAFVIDDWTILCANKSSGWASMEDFVAAAKESEMKWGLTSAAITIADSYRVMSGLGINCSLVPYDGGSETISALMGNHINVALMTASESTAYIESGDFVPLGVIGTGRCPSLPDTPTMLELGVEVDTGAPRAYFVPSGCSDEVVAYYDEMLREICEDQAFVDDMAAMGFTVSYTGAEEGQALMEKWYESLKPVFEEYGLAN